MGVLSIEQSEVWYLKARGQRWAFLLFWPQSFLPMFFHFFEIWVIPPVCPRAIQLVAHAEVPRADHVGPPVVE
ncbi:unnamed protein product [Prunus armeniaca]